MARRPDAGDERNDPEFRTAIDALIEYRHVNKTEIARAAGLAVSGLKRAYAGKGSMTSLKIAAICQSFGIRRSEFWRWGEDRYELALRHTLEMEGCDAMPADPAVIDKALGRLLAADKRLGREILLRHLRRLENGSD